MENASKALLIAGGILLALMTLSLVVYMSGATSRMMEAQDEKKAAEELAAFNMEYEAYNKRRMYGTDIITVVNKAINNNKSMRLNASTDPYYINIIIIPKQEFKTTIYEVDNTKEKSEMKPVDPLTTEAKNVLGITSETFKSFFTANKEEELGKFGAGTFVDNNNFKYFFEGDTEDKSKTTVDGKKRYVMYSALTNFKKSIFECKADKVEYDEKTGRIKSMTFEQILINN